jgi:hypothetical protein
MLINDRVISTNYMYMYGYVYSNNSNTNHATGNFVLVKVIYYSASGCGIPSA